MSHALAWDCGTGNGQAATALAEKFNAVVATDISADQIAHAASHPRIRYAVAPAANSGLDDASCDLVVVAQALHWFATAEYFAEVSRVAARGAFFCAWGYSWPTVDLDIDRDLLSPFRALIEPYWASNNRILWDGYRQADVPMPWPRIITPEFAIDVDWTHEQFVGYLTTWSAYTRASKDNATRVLLDEVIDRSRRTSAAGAVVHVHMPLTVVAARVGSPG